MIHIPTIQGGDIEVSSKPVFTVETGVLTNVQTNGQTNIVIPDGVVEIGENVFDGNEEITSVQIPDGCTKIGKYAFNFCKKLASVQLPESLTEIEEGAFLDCDNLAEVKFIGKTAQQIRELTDIDGETRFPWDIGHRIDDETHESILFRSTIVGTDETIDIN